MGTLRPNSQETLMKRNMALEYFKLHGIDADFYAISIEQNNLYGDDEHAYDEPKTIPVIFQQFPDIRTLKKLGWYTGDTEALPIIMYIPFYDKDGEEVKVRDNAKLRLSVEVPSVDTNTFKIKKVAGKSFSTMYWVVNVTPVHLSEAKSDEGDTDKDGFSFINIGG